MEPDARAQLRMTMYRIVEECVSNALLHAGATHIDIDVRLRPGTRRSTVVIEVVNNLMRVEELGVAGAGIRVMRARAAGYDGDVTTERLGDRFRTTATLLLP